MWPLDSTGAKPLARRRLHRSAPRGDPTTLIESNRATTPTDRGPLMAINPEDFGASFKGFLDQMNAHKKPAEEPFFVRSLRDHFGADPTTLPIVSETFPTTTTPTST